MVCDTTADAIARALPVLASSAAPGIYDTERPEVWDRGAEWFVRFPRFEPMIPNFGLVVVTKATGGARWVALR